MCYKLVFSLFPSCWGKLLWLRTKPPALDKQVQKPGFTAEWSSASVLYVAHDPDVIFNFKKKAAKGAAFGNVG